MPGPSPLILLVHCADRPGLVAAVTSFLARRGGNILHLDQHVDLEANVFFMRLEFDPSGLDSDADGFAEAFGKEIARPHAMTWRLYDRRERPRLAILVSKYGHCLYDLLARVRGGELRAEVPVVISNHSDLEPVARGFGVRFAHIPNTPATRAEAEARMLAELEGEGVRTVVLARYMQVLSAGFTDRYPQRVINIHHSFLPAFAGGRPYHQAHARGVKLIGATSHYVTPDLDQGPIIEQDIARVTHRDAVADLIRKGRDLERVVLARAVWLHLERRVLAYHNKTVVFA